MIQRVFAAILVLFSTFSAHAALQPLVQISAELYPGETYHIGVTTNEEGKLSQLYYENEKHEILYYDLKLLENDYTIMKKDEYDVVKLQATFDPVSNTAAVKFKYLYSGIVKKYRTAGAIVKFNVNTQRYELFNEDNLERPVSTAYVVSRYWGKKVIGISEINLK